jgi:NADPH:quinone reductase-like Zn-dependent oxidoreductase
VRVGDAVFGRQKLLRILQGRGGACAEWCVVEALDVLSKPANITHEQAAAIPSAALVAFAALVETLRRQLHIAAI